jgi:DNA-binding NarL/FixJ family response regulator
MAGLSTLKVPYGLMVLVLVQTLCAAFFVSDIVADYSAMGMAAYEQWHLRIEALATLSLGLAIVFEVRFILTLLRRKAHLEHSASIATMAMHDVIEAHFDAWNLTPSERDVATFMVKGLGIAEIAQLRGTAEGTIKSHQNAIYRKSGARNRGEVLSQIIDSLMAEDYEKPSETARHPA